MDDHIAWQAGVVAIIGQESKHVGAGFVVSAEGLILTCAHVLQAAGWSYRAWSEPVQVRFEANRRFAEALVEEACFSEMTKDDFALLRLEDGLPEGVKVLPLGPAAGSESHTVNFRGYPADHRGVMGGDGRVLALVTTRDGRQELQLHSEHATHGFSGGPVWDPARQRAIGLFQRGRKAPDEIGRLAHVAYATPAEALNAACPDRLVLHRVEELHAVSSDAEYLAGRQDQILERFDRPREPRPAIEARPPESKTDSFVGRDDELAWLRERLRAGQTAAVAGLRGIGGIGKTELAIQALEELQADFPGGVHWLSCGPGDVLAIQDRLADALALPELPPVDLARRANALAAALAARPPSLIVLDDIRRRHLDHFDYLRPPSPPCALLVTSRRTDLPLPEAAIHRLDVLDEPAARDLLTRLLEDAWTAPAQAALVDIIALLERIPLALQLAARQARRIARRRDQKAARVLPDLLAQLRERRRVRVLDGGLRPDLSVIVTFDISYDELDRPDQERLLGLGVFAGNDFELEAAAAVWEDEAEAARQALARLENAGLVEETAAGWWLHDLLREYAAERLAAGENQAFQQAARLNHAAYWKLLLESSERLEVEDWRQLAAVRPEVEAAADWLATDWQMEPGLAAELIVEITQAYQDHSFSQWSTWLEGGIKAAESTNMTNAARRLQRSLGEYHRSYGDLRRAEELLRGSLQTAQGILRQADAEEDEQAIDDGRRGVAVTQSSLADLLSNRGQYDEAERLYRESLAVFEEIGDRREVAVTQSSLAALLSNRGQYDEAERLYRESLAVKEEIGDRRSVAVTQYMLAELRRSQDSLVEADALYRSALELAGAAGDRMTVAGCLMRLGQLALVQGQQQEAIPLLEEARERFLDIGLPNWAAQAEQLLAQAQGESQSMTLDDVLALVRAARAGDEDAIQQVRSLLDALAQAEQAELQVLGQAMGRLLGGADPAAEAANLSDELAQQLLAFDW